MGSEGDHIVLTGDLTDNAIPHDFLILRKLLERLNLLDSDKLSVVIGNHDIFGGVQTAEDIFTFPDKCSKVNYNQKVKEFYQYFPELFENCIKFNPLKVFPFVKPISNFLLIGLNSISEYSRMSNPFASNGIIELTQLNEVSEILEEFKGNDFRKIVLTHHHFSKMKIKNNSPGSFWQNIEKQTMRLKKKKRLLKIFKHFGVELVLHGHYHVSREYTRKSILFSNAGASFKGAPKGVIQINIIDIEEKHTTIRVESIDTEKTLKSDSYELFYNELLMGKAIELETV
jgi:3',5'-cyclic AMP phosphodiesterase CpdA